MKTCEVCNAAEAVYDPRTSARAMYFCQNCYDDRIEWEEVTLLTGIWGGR